MPSFALQKFLAPIQRSSLGIFLTLVLLGLAVFGNAIDHPFVHDDIVFIQENPYIKKIDLAEIFTYTSSSSGQHAITNTYWRPLLELVYRLEYKLFGFEAPGYHLINVLIHIVNAFLVYWLVFLIVGSRQMLAWAAAVLFLVHPIQSEAVACISGISNLLFAMLVMGSLLLYWQSRLEGRTAPFAGSLLLFVLALLAKEQAVILPLLILFLEWVFLKAQRPSPLRKIGGYFVVLFFYLLYRTTFIGTIVSYSLSNNVELMLRLASMPKTLLMYIRLFFFPYDLHYYRSTDILEPVLVPTVIFAVLCALIVWTVAKAKGGQKKILIFSIGWFLINWAPTSNILPLINEYSLILSAEHFMYLPMVGVTVFLFTALEGPIDRYREKLPLLFLLWVMVLGAITIQQNTIWRGEIPLFQRTLRYEKDFARVHSLLGGAYLFDGQYARSIESYAKAYRIMEGYSQKAVEPKSRKFYRNYMKTISFNLAHAHESLDQFPQAIEWMQKAIAIDANDPVLFNNVGLDYIRLNQPKRAEFYFEQALRLDPGFVMAQNNLAILFVMQGRKKEAAYLFMQVLKVDPQNQAALQNYQRLLSETRGE